jgi:putative hemolysin
MKQIKKTLVLFAILALFLGCTQTNPDSMPIIDEVEKKGCLVSEGYTWCEAKQKCLQAWIENCPIEEPEEQLTQIANPASTNCIEHKGTLKIITDKTGGQIGICVLPNGNECEEWALLRRECGQ